MVPLRLLMIEDDTNDEQLIVHALRHSGYDVTHQRVDNAPALVQALEEPWDVATCDWTMPAFSAPDALSLVARHELPVIVVSGEVVEKLAASAKQLGARDVISKSQLTDLGYTIRRELGEAKARQRRPPPDRNDEG